MCGEENKPAHEVAKELLKKDPEKYGEFIQSMYERTKAPKEELEELIKAFEEAGVEVPSGLEEQSEEQELGVFIKVFNLKSEEIKREAFLKSFEEQVMEVLRGNDNLPLVPDDFPFSFPWDPSVVSAEIPVVVEVNLFPGDNEDLDISQDFTEEIGNALDFFEKERNIWVSLPQLDILSEIQ
ncbi:MAG: hypothetical protein V5A57_03340 [Candidatus Paceibacterota bacterium]